ncbi:MAG: tetratricopeptide repeat protein [Myxococcales bacterium]|nr:tetratricopeptide repeat protein [Myxococcales bacterium]
MLALRTRLLGADHPDVASSSTTLGRSSATRAGSRRGRRALTSRRCACGWPRSDPITRTSAPRSTTSAASTSIAASWRRRRRSLRRALATWARVFGQEHPALAIPLGNLGDVALARGDDAHALDLCRRAYAVERRPPARSPRPSSPTALPARARRSPPPGSRRRDRRPRARLELREAAAVDAAELAHRLALAIALDARAASIARGRAARPSRPRRVHRSAAALRRARPRRWCGTVSRPAASRIERARPRRHRRHRRAIERTRVERPPPSLRARARTPSTRGGSGVMTVAALAARSSTRPNTPRARTSAAPTARWRTTTWPGSSPPRGDVGGRARLRAWPPICRTRKAPTPPACRPPPPSPRRSADRAYVPAAAGAERRRRAPGSRSPPLRARRAHRCATSSRARKAGDYLRASRVG